MSFRLRRRRIPESGMPASRANDEGDAFSWQAADELLSALAASPSAHHRLAALKQVAARAEAKLGVPISFTAWNGGGSALLLAAVPQAMAPEERAEADSLIDALADSTLPLASELLERLDNERIRPELVGLSRPGLGSAVAMLEQAHLEGAGTLTSGAQGQVHRNSEHDASDEHIHHSPRPRTRQRPRQGPCAQAEPGEPDDGGRTGTSRSPPPSLPEIVDHRTESQDGVKVDMGIEPGQGQGSRRHRCCRARRRLLQSTGTQRRTE